MFRVLATLFLLQWCSVGGQNEGDLASLIAQIFGNNTEERAPSSGTTGAGSESQTGVTNAPVFTTSSAKKDLSCKTESGENGECVLYYLCNNNSTINTDGIGLIDIRGREGPCESYMDTCCLTLDTRPPDNPITPAPTKKEEIKEGCGWRNRDGIGFRIQGDKDNEVSFGEFPWVVALYEVLDEETPDDLKSVKYLGGGSLIHPSVVLTAAHYVAVKKSLRVRAGEWDTQIDTEIYPYQSRAVEQVIVHKDFNSGNLFYDIAVLMLAAPMVLAPNVGVACLPPERQRVEAGVRCFASGWGKDQFGLQGQYQVILKKVEVPVVDRRSCEASLRKTRLGPHFMLHSSFMCAGGEAGRDTCKGDGGSPLVCPIEGERDRYVQSGIVAWGIGCGDDGTPGVYVDVAAVRGWVDDAVRGKGLDSRIYSYEI